VPQPISTVPNLGDAASRRAAISKTRSAPTHYKHFSDRTSLNAVTQPDQDRSSELSRRRMRLAGADDGAVDTSSDKQQPQTQSPKDTTEQEPMFPVGIDRGASVSGGLGEPAPATLEIRPEQEYDRCRRLPLLSHTEADFATFRVKVPHLAMRAYCFAHLVQAYDRHLPSSAALSVMLDSRQPLYVSPLLAARGRQHPILQYRRNAFIKHLLKPFLNLSRISEFIFRKE